MNKDHAYDRLGLVPGASRADITRAYRGLLAATALDAPGSPIPVRRMRAAGPPPLVAGPVHVMPAPRRRRGGDDG